MMGGSIDANSNGHPLERALNVFEVGHQLYKVRVEDMPQLCPLTQQYTPAMLMSSCFFDRDTLLKAMEKCPRNVPSYLVMDPLKNTLSNIRMKRLTMKDL